MHLAPTPLRDVKLLTPRLFADDRGWFSELYNHRTFAQETLAQAGIPQTFVQENQSHSKHGVLRGLHYQLERPQGKLIRVLAGRIWDVAVDLRRNSPDFGRHAAFELQPLTPGGELQLLWIPEGFAHGFLVLSDTADVLYKTTDFYYPSGERTLRWDDPTLGIPWPLASLNATVPGLPLVSVKDAQGATLLHAELP